MSAQHSHDHVTPTPCCGAAPASSTAPVFAPGAGEQVSRIHIEQMDCPTEERLIRQRLTGMAGVGTLHFNLLQRVLSVSHLPERREAVLTAINELGFSPRLLVDDHRPEASAGKPWWPLAPRPSSMPARATVRCRAPWCPRCVSCEPRACTSCVRRAWSAEAL